MSFPQVGQEFSGGTNFKSLVPGYITNSTASTTLVTLISIVGKGFLVGLNQGALVSAITQGTVKVTLDGVVVINDVNFSATISGAARHGELTCMYYFKQSLLIEHASSSGTGTYNTRASYLLG